MYGKISIFMEDLKGAYYYESYICRRPDIVTLMVTSLWKISKLYTM